MNCYQYQRLAEIEALKIEVMGMLATNQQRERSGYALAYDEESFNNIADAIRYEANEMVQQGE